MWESIASSPKLGSLRDARMFRSWVAITSSIAADLTTTMQTSKIVAKTSRTKLRQRIFQHSRRTMLHCLLLAVWGNVVLAEDVGLTISPECEATFAEYEAFNEDASKSFALRLDGAGCAWAHDYGSASATEDAALAFCRRTGGECATFELTGGAAEQSFDEQAVSVLLERLRGNSDVMMANVSPQVFGSWQVSTLRTANGLRCTVLANPTTTDSKAKRIGKPEFRIFNEGEDPYVVSVNVQLVVSSQSLHYAVIDGVVYPLFSPQNPIVLKSYARGPGGEVSDESTRLANKAIARALGRGKDLAIKATTRDGVEFEDRYSLMGLSQALAVSRQLCEEE